VAILAAETRRINDRNLDIRLPVHSAKDEVSDLALTLNRMLERIDKAFASVRTFTGNASHELRTPISLMRTEIEVALYRPRNADEYRAILGRLHEGTVRMTNLVENLLSLARADGGTETIVLAPIRVETLFREVAGVWKNAMDHAMHDFRVEMPEGDLVLLCDSLGISRLLSILLENASKYTPPGGVVTLRASAEEERANISVRDTGIGIDSVHRDRVFERFFRVPNAGSVPVGSGLGLSLAKWIAVRHGTQLRVESAPGRGSCFSFSLKRSDAGLPASHDSTVTSGLGIKL
jgi:signal transduction histidine kinase